jgi:hypothetical protein
MFPLFAGHLNHKLGTTSSKVFLNIFVTHILPQNTSAVDPDPDGVRIQWRPWIRTRIRNPDPDPGGQK